MQLHKSGKSSMKHVEKLDRILKMLYEHYRYKRVDLGEAIAEHQTIPIESEEELDILSARLDEENLTTSNPHHDGVIIGLTSRGIEYCEGESFSASIPLVRLFEPTPESQAILDKLDDISDRIADQLEMTALQSTVIASFLDEIKEDIKNNHRPEPSKYLQLIKKLSQINGATSLLGEMIELIPQN